MASPASHAHTLIGISARALALSVLLVIATYLGITRLGFIKICWVPYVIPPVPALLFLLVLQGVNVGLKRLWERSGADVSTPSQGQRVRGEGRTGGLAGALEDSAHHRGDGRSGEARRALFRPFHRGELFLIYAAVCISLSMDRGGYIIHYLSMAQYYGDPANRFGEIFEKYPDFYVPHDPEVLAGFFEGSADRSVPWGEWSRPLGWWSAFNLTLMFAVLCLAAIFRKQWVEAERLTFPLLFLPIEMTGGLPRQESVARGFFRNPVMWVGFSLAAAYNGLNMLHAFFPTVPGIPWAVRIDQGLTEGPLRHLRPLGMSFSLDVWGLSYLVSGEVLLSGWLFYFLLKFVKVMGREWGYQGAGFPHFQEVSAGACIAFTGFMLWAARQHLRDVGRGVLQGMRAGSEEAFPYRVLVIGLVVATVVLVWMLAAAGQNVWVLVAYFATLYMYVLVACRVRAEVGPPVAWNHPYGFDQRTPVHLMGTRALRAVEGERGTVLYYALFWIGRTIFAHSAGQYVTDGLRLADYGSVCRRSVAIILLVACVVGLAMTWWYHLDVGYKYGQGLIGAKTGRAGRSWAMNWSRGQYMQLQQALWQARGPQPSILAAYGSGCFLALLLTVLRARFAAFPLHPLGLMLGTLYGDYSPYWWPFLLAWVAQRATLRYGGLSLYRRLVPGFLGLAFGHILIGGILWRIIINYFIDPTISFRYYLNLGG